MYQREIAWTCLKYNTLVCLPTGTGKTLIAAVAMYNFHRWYPTSKVLFVAPTKPLVNQQRRAVCDIVGLPFDQTAAITSGAGQDSHTRKALWQSNVVRALFATPQAVMADMEKSLVPLNEIVFVCVDECHKAQGAYSYVELLKKLHYSEHEFRVLGLSATPGKDMRQVKDLFVHLKLQRIELRTEADEDLAPYLQARDVEKIVCSRSDSVGEIKNALDDCIRNVANGLMRANIGWMTSDPGGLHVFVLNRFLRDFCARMDEPSSYPHLERSERFHLAAEIKTVTKLKRVQEQLSYGVRGARDEMIRSFIGNERGWIIQDDGSTKEATKAVKTLRESQTFKKAWRLLTQSLESLEDAHQEDTPIVAAAASSTTPNASSIATSITSPEFTRKLSGLLQHHPKIGRLVEIVSSHFAKWQQRMEWMNDDPQAKAAESEEEDEDTPVGGVKFTGCASQSNVIVFTEYRNSADEIVDRLNQFHSLCGISASVFVGQASKGKKKGMTQKEQAAVLDKFRDGTFNVLVATSVAEEGLDIGHVDLIVSFDVVGSALRIVQRFGRTGRKRKGRCVTLVEAGKDEQNYDNAWQEKNKLLNELKREGRQPSFAPKGKFMQMIPDGIVPAETLVEVRSQRAGMMTTAQTRAARAGGKSSSSKAAQDALEDKLSWIVPPSEAVRLQRIRAEHPDVCPTATVRTSPGPACLVWHSRTSVGLAKLAALMQDQQKQLEDGGEEASTKKRRRLNEESSRQLESIMETSAVAAADEPMRDDEVIVIDSPERQRRSLGSSPRELPKPAVTSLSAKQPPEAAAAASAASSSAKKPASHTLTEMFQKQNAAAHQTSNSRQSTRRKLELSGSVRSASMEEFFPNPSNAFLSLLTPALQQLSLHLEPLIRAARERKKRKRLETTDQSAKLEAPAEMTTEELMGCLEERKDGAISEAAIVEQPQKQAEDIKDAVARTPTKPTESSQLSSTTTLLPHAPTGRSTLNAFNRVAEDQVTCTICQRAILKLEVRKCAVCPAVMGCAHCAGAKMTMCNVCMMSFSSLSQEASSTPPRATFSTSVPTVTMLARPPPSAVPVPIPHFLPPVAATPVPPQAPPLPAPVVFNSLYRHSPSRIPSAPSAGSAVAMPTAPEAMDMSSSDEDDQPIRAILTQAAKRLSQTAANEHKQATVSQPSDRMQRSDIDEKNENNPAEAAQTSAAVEEKPVVELVEIVSDSERSSAASDQPIPTGNFLPIVLDEDDFPSDLEDQAAMASASSLEPWNPFTVNVGPTRSPPTRAQHQLTSLRPIQQGPEHQPMQRASEFRSASEYAAPSAASATIAPAAAALSPPTTVSTAQPTPAVPSANVLPVFSTANAACTSEGEGFSSDDENLPLRFLLSHPTPAEAKAAAARKRETDQRRWREAAVDLTEEDEPIVRR